MSHGSLSYTCTNNNSLLKWSSSVLTSDFEVVVEEPSYIPTLTVSGVTLTENASGISTCLSSTLTFTGTSSNLTQLNGVVLNCSGPLAPTGTITIAAGKLALLPNFTTNNIILFYYFQFSQGLLH